MANEIGQHDDPESVSGNGSVIALLKRQRTLLGTIAASAIIGGAVVVSGRLTTAPAVATAAAPTYSEGTSVPLSTDLAGTLRAGGGGGGGNPAGGWLDSVRRVGRMDSITRVGRMDSVTLVRTLDSLRSIGRVLVDSAFVVRWFGSSAPTVGQKTMANSLPVVVSSDQSSVNVNCTGGCAGASEAQTYIATVTASAAAASKDHLNIFNASGSGKVLKVRAITVSPEYAAAIVGLVQSFIIQKTSTAGTTCTAITIRLFDNTNAAVPAQVTSTANCTTDPTNTFQWLTCAQDGEETRSSITTYGNCYRFPANGGQPFTLREGEGLSIRSSALSGAWPVTAAIEFTM